MSWKYTVTDSNDWKYMVSEYTGGLRTKADGFILTKAGKIIQTKQ
ncbi:hypothetical protein LCGC14_1546350 [marine sediment metagenome]|uniref:Uncharacterized protein n=1 Tax=marine sediment metagenome TaxID=412755 RepID=A0A0F9IRJ7_9ZZZZ